MLTDKVRLNIIQAKYLPEKNPTIFSFLPLIYFFITIFKSVDIGLAEWEGTKHGIQNITNSMKPYSCEYASILLSFQTKQKDLNYMQPICVIIF